MKTLGTVVKVERVAKDVDGIITWLVVTVAWWYRDPKRTDRGVRLYAVICLPFDQARHYPVGREVLVDISPVASLAAPKKSKAGRK